jgi:kynurenine formamidase
VTGQRLVDLSHPVISGALGYPGLPVARIEPYIAHAASRPAYDGQAEFEITRVFLVGNTGTYLDSPYHRDPGRPDVAALPLSSIAGLPGRRVRSDWRGPGPRPVRPALPNDLVGCAVLIATGWDRRWGHPAYWRPGPFVDTRLADELVAAGVALVGVDFWNVDDIRDPSRPAHTRLLRAGIPIVEHLTGLDALPDSGFRFTAVPAPIQAAASLPVRAFAEMDEAGSF